MITGILEDTMTMIASFLTDAMSRLPSASFLADYKWYNGQSMLPTSMSMMIMDVSSKSLPPLSFPLLLDLGLGFLFLLFVVGWFTVLFHRLVRRPGQQWRDRVRRQREAWKHDSRRFLAKVQDVVLQLEEREDQVDILEHRLQVQRDVCRQQEETFATALDEQTVECTQLHTQVQALELQLSLLRAQHLSTESKLQHAAQQLLTSQGRTNDLECQLLEQKLETRLLQNTSQQQVNDLQHANAVLTTQIQTLQAKRQTDCQKVQDVLQSLTAERDERYALLQQDNEHIQTHVLALLQQTKERHDADKMAWQKELQAKQAKITALQQEQLRLAASWREEGGATAPYSLTTTKKVKHSKVIVGASRSMNTKMGDLPRKLGISSFIHRTKLPYIIYLLHTS